MTLLMPWNIRRLSKRSNSSATEQVNGNGQSNGDATQPTPAQNINRASTYHVPLSKRNTYDETVQSARGVPRGSPSPSAINDSPADDLSVKSRGSFSKETRNKSISKNRDKFGRDCRTDRNMASAAVHKMLHGKQDHAHEVDFVAHFGDSDNQSILRPEEITSGAKEKGLGQSSKMLKRDDFEFLKTLGTGTFARVWLVKLKSPRSEDRDKVYALKVLKKADVVRLKQVDHVNSERAILADVAGHPFITTLITTFSDHENLYMLLDYCPGGEVFSYLRKRKRFSEETARFYVAEIVLILEFLHESEGVAYRDLKPENILLDKEGHVKLVDFGFAKRVDTKETYTLCGTPEYLAPEVIQSEGHSTAVDWWALGILLYEFITGYPPFWHSNPLEIYKQIVHKPIAFTEKHPVSPEAQDLIRGLCTVDRTKRLGNVEGGAKRVKAHPFFAGVDWDQVYFRKMKGPIIPPVRFPGDSQCFDNYPDEDAHHGRKWTRSDAFKWDHAFNDF